MEKGAAKSASKSDIKLLVENSVALQKVLTEVALSLNQLTKEISQLLHLFREATKNIAEEKAVKEVNKGDKTDLIDKLDALIEQNRTIAKGLILLESTLKERDNSKEFRL